LAITRQVNKDTLKGNVILKITSEKIL